MLRTLCISLLSIISSISAIWASDFSHSARVRLDMLPALSRAEGASEPFIPIILQVADDQVADRLADYDVVIYHHRDDMLLTAVPYQRVYEVLALPGVMNLEISGDMSACMDRARVFGHVDQAQQMLTDHGYPYDGTGVIVGFVDNGFDNQHIAFRDRVVALYDYDIKQNKTRAAESPLYVSRWVTDNPDEWHATHVANIMAGGYMQSPYYGVATGAQIVGATSRLSDVGILSGVEDIIAYGQRRNRPIVINMSLGNNVGPHDGTSLFCRYLSSCAKDAIICLSAGNTGGHNGYAYQRLTDDSEVYRVVLNDRVTWKGLKVDGLTEIWSENATPFDFRLEVYDKEINDIVYATDWFGDADDFGIVLDDTDECWTKYMSGKVVAQGGLSPLNSRYTVSVGYDYSTEFTYRDFAYSRYYLSLAVRGSKDAPPTLVDFFADTHNSLIGKAGCGSAPVFTHDGSISDFCTADGVIAVGACSSRNSAPSLTANSQSWGFEENQIAQFSSYSRRPNMPRLPHFAAPGNYTVSAISSPFLKLHSEDNGYLAAFSMVDDELYYWAAMCGTSMASPYAAGVIALWLQANPNLTTQEIIEIAQSTAITSYADIDHPAWGAGCIDARAGLERVLAAHPNISTDAPTSIHVFTIDGIEVDASRPLSSGIYIVTSPDGPAHKIKISGR